jgi:DNA-binding response OmpR family regulator
VRIARFTKDGGLSFGVVEDDETIARAIGRRLDAEGFAVDVAGDGEAAVAYLAQAQTEGAPGLVLLDLKLPRRPGLDVLGWLRQQPGLRRLPVVVLTSSRESADVNRAYDLGANSFLVKPVGFAELLEMVRTLGLYWLQLNQAPELESETNA